ncbi:MAG: BlaI/MecI/CopY family transcriptional regulator [Alistipes sp.]|nr:BlaI/MecI/CopY family transcriptional regulator [Alistipes sp.]
MQLTSAEQQIMGYLWKLGRGYMKNIMDEFPDPKPAPTTVATLLKRMTDKGFIGFEQHGSNREYYPKVKKEDYFSGHLNHLISNFFNNSSGQFASFFAEKTTLSPEQLKELREIIDKKLEQAEK